MRHVHKRPAFRALLGTSIGSVPGFLVPFAVAKHFGIGRDSDAYVFALAIATFGLTLAFSVLEANVLPLARFYAAKGSGPLRRFAKRSAAQAFVVVGCLELPVAVIGVFILTTRASWTVAERETSATAIGIFLFLVATCGVTSVLAGCLYALNDFVVPTVSQALRSLVPLAGLTVLGRGRLAVEELAALVVAGEVMRACILVVFVRWRTRTLEPRPALREPMALWRVAGPAALGVVVIALNPIVDRTVAARFSPGSVTVLDLGEKIFYVPFTVVQASVVLVAGARWAQSFVEDPESLRGDFGRSLRVTIVVSSVLAVLAIAALYSTTGLIGRNLAGVGTSEIRTVTTYFLIGLPAATTWILCARLMTVSQQTHLLPLFAVVGLVVNLVSDLVGSAFLQVNGVALGSTFASLALAGMGVATCKRLLKHDFPRNPWRVRPTARPADGPHAGGP